MAKYTTEVRSICETLAGYDEHKGYQSVNEIIQNSREQIFNFQYPIFDNLYKPIIEAKILKHYYGREIGAETFGRWQLWLDTKLNEIMPYYNKLYQSELLEFNPLYDVDLTTTYTKEGERTGTENETIDNDTTHTSTESLNKTDEGTITDSGSYSNTRTDNLSRRTADSGSESDVRKNDRWDIFSDTPQGSLQNIKTGDGAYLTEARHITDDGTGSTKTFGKIVQETDTGTVQNTGTDSNTRTLDTETNQGIEKSETGTNDTTTEREHTINTTEEYLHHVVGKTGGISYAKLLDEYRKTFLNIDMMIIRDLKELFMCLW